MSKRTKTVDARRKRTCRKKQSFSSVKEAKERAEKIKENSGLNLEPYRCQFCGKFHLMTRR